MNPGLLSGMHAGIVTPPVLVDHSQDSTITNFHLAPADVCIVHVMTL